MRSSALRSLNASVLLTASALTIAIGTAVLAALGESGLAGYIDGQFALTHQAYEVLRGIPGLECLAEPLSNILCFRVAGGDEEQLRVRDRLLAEGDFHLSTAVAGGRRYLRVVMTNPATTLDDIRRLASRVLDTSRGGKPLPTC